MDSRRDAGGDGRKDRWKQKDGMFGVKVPQRQREEKENRGKRIQTPLHFSEVLSTVPSIFICFHIILHFVFF